MKRRMMAAMLIFAVAAVSLAGCSGNNSSPVLEGSVISKSVSETSNNTEASKAGEASQESKASAAVSEASTNGFQGSVKLDQYDFTIEASSEDVSDGLTLHFKNGFTADVKVTNDWVGNAMVVLLTDTEGNVHGTTYDWNVGGNSAKLRSGFLDLNSEQTVTVAFSDVTKGTKAQSVTIKSVGSNGTIAPVEIKNNA